MKTRSAKLVRFLSLLATAVAALALGTVGVTRAQSQLDIKRTPILTVTGSPGSCEIQWAPATGTTGWTILTNLSFTTNPVTLADTSAGTAPQRFYRALAASGDTRLELRMRVSLTVSGTPGTHQIQFAEGWGWIVLTNVLVAGDPVTVDDASAPAHGQRSYRAYPVPENPDPVHQVWIPPGRFRMGSPASEVDRDSDEGPQTFVTLTRGFWMSKYEVTQGEYQAVMGTNPSSFTGDTNLPAEQVSWYDATNYCAKLTESERLAGRLPGGYAYRLPTEAEWEYAARAGTTTRFSYGDDPGYTSLRNHAWYDSNSGFKTHPVGEKLANSWGLYDMYGNVWKWCSDWYGGYPGGSVTDPKGPVTGSCRVLRGGSWGNFGRHCRSAFRDYVTPSYRGSIGGFRVVLAPGEP